MTEKGKESFADNFGLNVSRLLGNGVTIPFITSEMKCNYS